MFSLPFTPQSDIHHYICDQVYLSSSSSFLSHSHSHSLDPFRLLDFLRSFSLFIKLEKKLVGVETNSVLCCIFSWIISFRSVKKISSINYRQCLRTTIRVYHWHLPPHPLQNILKCAIKPTHQHQQRFQCPHHHPLHHPSIGHRQNQIDLINKAVSRWMNMNYDECQHDNVELWRKL